MLTWDTFSGLYNFSYHNIANQDTNLTNEICESVCIFHILSYNTSLNQNILHGAMLLSVLLKMESNKSLCLSKSITIYNFKTMHWRG